MPYALYDADGWLADGPTIRGWRYLRTFLLSAGDAGREFATTGSTEDPRELAREIEGMPEPEEGPLRSSALALREAAERADDILILSDGVGLEDEA